MDFTELNTRFADYPHVLNWLTEKAKAVRSEHTIIAYAGTMSDYLTYCAQHQIDYILATSQQVEDYFAALTDRPITRNNRPVRQQLSDNSRKFRLAVLRNFYLYAQEESIRLTATPIRRNFSFQRKQGLPEAGELPVIVRNNWMPNSKQWEQVLVALEEEPLRNRLMFCLAFECSLTVKELGDIRMGDVGRGSGKNMVLVRAETTRKGRSRREYFSDNTKDLLQQYLQLHHYGSEDPDKALFISESLRNRGQGLSKYTWRNVVKTIASRSGLHELTATTILNLGKHPDFTMWKTKMNYAEKIVEKYQEDGAAVGKVKAANTQKELRRARRIDNV